MKAYALTDIGKMRKVNQDAQFASTEPVGELSNLFVVADGMGGHQAGDFASRYLIEHMPEYIKESGENEPVAALRKGIEAVNQELYSLSCEREELAGMGTTLVAASIQGNTLYVANVPCHIKMRRSFAQNAFFHRQLLPAPVADNRQKNAALSIFSHALLAFLFYIRKMEKPCPPQLLHHYTVFYTGF